MLADAARRRESQRAATARPKTADEILGEQRQPGAAAGAVADAEDDARTTCCSRSANRTAAEDKITLDVDSLEIDDQKVDIEGTREDLRGDRRDQAELKKIDCFKDVTRGPTDTGGNGVKKLQAHHHRARACEAACTTMTDQERRDFWDRISPRERRLVVIAGDRAPLTLALWLGLAIHDGLATMETRNDRDAQGAARASTTCARAAARPRPVDDVLSHDGHRAAQPRHLPQQGRAEGGLHAEAAPRRALEHHARRLRDDSVSCRPRDAHDRRAEGRSCRRSRPTRSSSRSRASRSGATTTTSDKLDATLEVSTYSTSRRRTTAAAAAARAVRARARAARDEGGLTWRSSSASAPSSAIRYAGDRDPGARRVRVRAAVTFPYDRVRDARSTRCRRSTTSTIGGIERGWMPGRVYFKSVSLRTRPDQPGRAGRRRSTSTASTRPRTCSRCCA